MFLCHLLLLDNRDNPVDRSDSKSQMSQRLINALQMSRHVSAS